MHRRGGEERDGRRAPQRAGDRRARPPSTIPSAARRRRPAACVASARSSAVRHAWLSATSAAHAASSACGATSHSTAQKIAAPRPIDTVVRCPCRYSVATWSARARSTSPRSQAASGDIDGSAVQCASRPGVHRHAATRELDDRLRARVHVQRLEDRAHVHLHRSFRQPQVAADELVRLALHEELQHVAPGAA